MDTLKPNMYVRTEKGIGKVTECRKHDKWGYIIKILGQYSCFTHSSNKELSDVIKASYSIIDLIEPGDYVNGVMIESMNNSIKPIPIPQYKNECGKYIDFDESDIKSIVTKEQFEAMEYKVESEVK